jgi:MFS family permease
MSATFDRSQRALAVALACVVTVVAFEAMSVATVMPLVEKDLGGIAWYGWVFSGFTLSQLVGIVAAGRWCDRRAPVEPMIAGLVLFGAGLAVAGLAPSMPVLVGGRVLQGVGAGAAPAVAYVCIGRGFPPEMRPRVFALSSTAWLAPSLVGPPIASALGGTVGWRWVFLGLIPLAGVIGALATPAVARLGPPPAIDVDRPRVGVAVTVLVLGAGLLLAGADRRGAELVVLVLIGAVLTVVSLRRLTPPGTLRIARGQPAAVALRGFGTFAFFSIDVYITLALVDGRHVTTGIAAISLVVASFTWTGGSWLQARWVGRHGPRPLVAGGFALIAAAGVLFVAVLSPEVPYELAYLAWGLGGLGMGLSYSSISAATLARAEPGREGEATSSLQLVDSLGIAFGTGLAGAVVAAHGSSGPEVRAALRIVWIVSIAVALAGASLAGRLDRSVVHVKVDT